VCRGARHTMGEAEVRDGSDAVRLVDLD